MRMTRVAVLRSRQPAGPACRAGACGWRAAREPEVFAAKVAASRRAVDSLDRGLADGRPFVAGDAYTVADIALHAYVHCGADAGVDPAEWPAVGEWLARVERTPGFVNDLTPIPEHAHVGSG